MWVPACAGMTERGRRDGGGGCAGSCLRRNDGSLLRGYDGEERGADGEGAREVREVWAVSEPALLWKRGGLEWGGAAGLVAVGVLACG